MLNRRHVLKMLTPAVAGFAAGTPLWGQARYLQQSPIRQPRITDIQVQEIVSPLHDYNARALFRSQSDIPVRTVYVVRTDTGLEGYGEKWSPKTPEDLSSYLDTTPFDWFGSTHSMPMSMALYDLMGKILGIPLWKLLGPQVRKWVPVAAWTVSQPPEAMAEEVVGLEGGAPLEEGLPLSLVLHRVRSGAAAIVRVNQRPERSRVGRI